MATYKELQAQLADVEQLIVLSRAAEFQAALAEIRAKVAEFGFTEDDVFGKRGKTKRGRPYGYVVPPKYRDPKSGATWSGRGKAPRWIARIENRDEFLIVT